MKKELEQVLFTRYPKLFCQHNKSMTETSMCWGIQCEDGWFDLINSMCRMLQFHIDNNGHKQIEFTTIKEKFGTLSVYHQGADNYLEGVIAMVENMSYNVCEQCGTWDETVANKRTNGRYQILCKSCHNKKGE
jgi:hypothetical protein